MMDKFTVNFEDESYANQFWLLGTPVFPLTALGCIYSEKLFIGSVIVSSIILIMLVVALFAKKKRCPEPLRAAIAGLTSMFTFACLPIIIFILNGYDFWHFLYFWSGLAIIDASTNFIRKKTKVDAISNIETIQELKTEATDNSQLIESLFRDKWKVMNKLCNIYYEKSDSTGSLKFIVRDIEAELEELRSPESIADILATTDRCLNGTITQLREECSFLKEQDIEFLGLIFSGLSVRAVCYLTGIRKDSYYQKKNRLLRRIAESEAPHREEFIERLSKFTK